MDSQEWIYGQLACPACKQPLTKAIDLLICNGLQHRIPADGQTFHLDLMLPERRTSQSLPEAWKDRLKQMDAWYDDLVSHPESAKRLLDNDLGLFPKEIFSGPGPVLDVGGRDRVTPATFFTLTPGIFAWTLISIGVRPEWTSIADQGKEAQRLPGLSSRASARHLRFSFRNLSAGLYSRSGA